MIRSAGSLSGRTTARHHRCALPPSCAYQSHLQRSMSSPAAARRSSRLAAAQAAPRCPTGQSPPGASAAAAHASKKQPHGDLADTQTAKDQAPKRNRKAANQSPAAAECGAPSAGQTAPHSSTGQPPEASEPLPETAAAAAAAAPPAKQARKRKAAAAGPTRDLEANYWAQGTSLVAGVDEAGRGPLAGPVVAAACCIPAHVDIPGIDDSKKMTEEEREAAYQLLTTHPEVVWATAIISHQDIDDLNILQATMTGMRQAVEGLASRPGALLIDGNRIPSGLEGYAVQAVVGGDGKSVAIAAASVLAKVTRDRLMVEMDQQYPQYGFAQHKGYGVPAHLAALQQHGPCPEHRRSFEPVKSMTGWTRAPKEGASTKGKASASSTRGRKPAKQQSGEEAAAPAVTSSAVAAEAPPAEADLALAGVEAGAGEEAGAGKEAGAGGPAAAAGCTQVVVSVSPSKRQPVRQRGVKDN